MSESERAAMARVYCASGWAVFPVWWPVQGVCACPAGPVCASPAKHPIVRHGVNDASDDEQQAAAWWQAWPQANIGLPAGRNRLAVLDVDPRHGGVDSLVQLARWMGEQGEKLPNTLTAVTGSNGYHLVFAAPDAGIKSGANVFGNDLPGLDTRGRGGFVVAPPSVHVSGGTYTWLDYFSDIAPWPGLLAALMDPPPVVSVVKPAYGEMTDAYAAAALAGEVERVRSALEGGRNVALNVAAFKLGQLVAAGALDEMRVVDELSAAAVSAGLRLHETGATVRSGLRAGAKQPRAVR